MSTTAHRIRIPTGLVALVLLLGACSGDAASNSDSTTTAATEAPTTAAHQGEIAGPTEAPPATPTEAPTTAAHEDGTATAEPTAVPTEEPTAIPTETPTAAPTAEPTAIPTEAPTAAPTAEPTATPAEELFDGATAAAFYSTTCAACHGANREGIVGPGLTPDLLVENDAFYIDTILNGRPGTAMPPWAGIGVSPAEAQALVAFFRTAP